MEKVQKRKAAKKKFTQADLEVLSKEELIEKILQLDAHNAQLQNIISKNGPHGLKETKSKTFDFSKAHFRHILLKFYYLGWDYKGFAVQEDTCETIENYIFGAFIKTCLIKDRASSNYHRCGRTDKGVSAFSQVISIDVRSRYPEHEQNKNENIQNEIQYCKLLNRILPPQIQCISWSPVSPEFSARFDCIQRTYKYFFPKSNLNIKAMIEAGEYMLGCHDFRNLCKMDIANGVTEFVRNIKQITISPCNLAQAMDSENPYTMYVATITAKAFLWHQIRCIMAILFLVGEGKEDPIIVQQLLDVQNVVKKPQYNIASEIPLNLYHCDYENVGECVIDSETLNATISSLQKLWVEDTVKSCMMYTMLQDLQSLLPENNGLCQNDILVPGVKTKEYQPLLERKTCESLEDRIVHFTKKKKINDLNS